MALLPIQQSILGGPGPGTRFPRIPDEDEHVADTSPYADPFAISPTAPPGTIPSSIGALPGLDPIVEAETVARPQPIPFLPQDLSNQQVRRIDLRLEKIREAVHGIDPHVALNLAYSDLPLDEAVTQARIRAQSQPRSIWSRVGSGLLAPLKFTFIDAPEWLWRKTVVNGFQELAEAFGVDPTLAQKMSPGQIVYALLPGSLGTERDGKLVAPEEWDSHARWASGALDIAARFSSDPTIVMGKFRSLRKLPFGSQKLLGIQRSTRIQRTTADAEILEKFLTLGRRDAAREFLFGNLNTRQILQFAFENSNPLQRAFREMYELGKLDPDGAAKIAMRFSRRWGKFSTETALILQQAARVSPTYSQFQDLAIARFTGEINPRLASRMEQSARRYAELDYERREALLTAAELRANKLHRITISPQREFEGLGPLDTDRAVAGPGFLDPDPNIAGRGFITEPGAAGFSTVRSQAELEHIERFGGRNIPSDPNELRQLERTRRLDQALADLPEQQAFRERIQRLIDQRIRDREKLYNRPLTPFEREQIVNSVYADNIRGPLGATERQRGLDELTRRSMEKKRESLGRSLTAVEEEEIAAKVEGRARGTITVEDRINAAADPNLDTSLPERVIGRTDRPFDQAANRHGINQSVLDFELDLYEKMGAIGSPLSRHPSLGPSSEAQLLARDKFRIPELDAADRFLSATRDGKILPEHSLTSSVAVWMREHNIQPFEFPALRNMPVLRNLTLEMHPWVQVPVHDPARWLQFNRLARLFKMNETEAADFVQRAMRANPDNGDLSRVANDLVVTGYKRLGLADDEIDAIQAAIKRKQQDIYGVDHKGNGIYHRVSEAQADNYVLLTDPGMIRAVQRRWGRFIEQNPHRTSAQTARFFSDLIDQIHALTKRLWVTTPKTGYRISFEEQFRAMTAWGTSAVTNPIVAMAMISGWAAPKFAQKLAQAGTEASARRIAMDSRDVGTAQGAFQLGLLTAAERDGFAIHKLADYLSSAKDRLIYRRAQARAINDFVMNDALSLRIIQDGTAAARAWFLSDAPDAVAYRIRMKNDILLAGKQGRKGRIQERSDVSIHQARTQNPDLTTSQESRLRSKARTGVLDEVRATGRPLDNLESYFRTVRSNITMLNAMKPEIRQRLIALGRIDAHDIPDTLLARWLVAGMAPDLHLQRFTKVASDALSNITERFLATPSNIGRMYVGRVQMRLEIERRVAQVERRFGPGSINRDRLEDILADKKVMGDSFEHQLAAKVRAEITESIRDVLFDFRERSRLAETLRFVFPFGHAYQELMTTWGQIALSRPWIPHTVVQAWSAADDIPGFTYNDPSTNEKMFVVPLSQWFTKFAGLKKINPVTGMDEGVGIPLVGRLSGLNLVTGSDMLPGFGPFVQIPAGWVVNHLPTPKEVVDIIFPFGQSALFDNFSPGWTKRLRQTIAGEGDRIFANQAKELVAAEIFSALKEGRPISDIDTDKVVGATRTLFALRLFSSIVSPTGVFGGDLPEGDIDSSLRQVLEYYHFAQRADPALADRMVLERYGPEIFAALQNKTKVINRGRRPNTLQARGLLVNGDFRKLVDTYGEVAWEVFKGVSDGDFDYREYLRQLDSGERVPYTLNEFSQQALANVGWQRWFMFRNSLERQMLSQGIPNFQVKQAEPYRLVKDAFEERLSLAMPEWASERARGGKERLRETNIVRLARLASLPEVRNLEAIKGAREYFYLRQQLINFMQANNIKSLNSRDGFAARLIMLSSIREIARRNPAFIRVYGRFLDRDPFTPLEDMLISTGQLQERSTTDSFQGAA